jgi:uncharacterized protein (DUF1778 family)
MSSNVNKSKKRMVAARLTLSDHATLSAVAVVKKKSLTSFVGGLLSEVAARQRKLQGEAPLPAGDLQQPVKRLKMPPGPVARIQYQLPGEVVRDFKVLALRKALDPREMLVQAMTNYMEANDPDKYVPPAAVIAPAQAKCPTPVTAPAYQTLESSTYSPEVAAGLDALDNELGLEN